MKMATSALTALSACALLVVLILIVTDTSWDKTLITTYLSAVILYTGLCIVVYMHLRYEYGNPHIDIEFKRKAMKRYVPCILVSLAVLGVYKFILLDTYIGDSLLIITTAVLVNLVKMVLDNLIITTKEINKPI